MSVTVDVDLRDKLDVARDQGQRPTCLVFAVSAAHEFKRNNMAYLSPEYLFYVGAQRTHKDPKLGLARTVVRDALMQDGQPLDVDWPYRAESPDTAAWMRISLHRDQAFRRIVITRFAHRDHPFRAS